MKKLARFVLLVGVVCASSSQAEIENFGSAKSKGGSFGLGAMLGDPVSISGKYFLTDTTAVDLGVGYGFSEDDGFQVQLDYVIHPHVFTRNDDFLMSWFIGAGSAVLLGDDSNINVRVPVGLTFTFMEQPIEAFLEFAPGLGLVDDFGFAFDGGIGARFFF